MKYILYILRIVLPAVALSAHLSPVSAEGIRIVPHAAYVRNDSLHLHLEMDLNAVRVNTLTSVSFTPVLKGKQDKLELPPVIITGTRRYRFERRERALTSREIPLPIPYLVLLDNRKTRSKNVEYKISVPYTSWMGNALLLLRQEVKDCCDLQLLGTDTLTCDLAVNNQPVAPQPIPTDRSATIPAAVTSVAHPTDTLKPRPAGKRQATGQPTVVMPLIALVMTSGNTYISVNQQTRSALLYIDYPLGKDDFYPDYKNNRKELQKVEEILNPLFTDETTRIHRIRIRGYASPDGDYRNNEQLAANRSRLFSQYVCDTYDIPYHLFDVTSVAEDWDGLTYLLNQTKPAYYRDALDVIHRYGVFSGREKHLMELQGGAPYKDMLRRLFPKLRRIEVVVEYEVERKGQDE